MVMVCGKAMVLLFVEHESICNFNSFSGYCGYVEVKADMNALNNTD